MPSPVDDDPLAVVNHLPVAVADAIYPRYGEAAALDIKGVEDLEDGLAPHVGVDAERMAALLAGFQSVRTRLPNLREVHHLEAPQIRLDRLNRLGEHRYPIRLVDQPELLGAQTTGDGGLHRTGLVARVAVRDSPRPHPPPLYILLVHIHAFQLQMVQVEDEGILLLRFVTTYRVGDRHARHVVPGHIPEVQVHVVPLLVFQERVIIIHDHGTARLPSNPSPSPGAVAIAKADAQVDQVGAGTIRIDPQRNPVELAPILAIEPSCDARAAPPSSTGRARPIQPGRQPHPKRVASVARPLLGKRHLGDRQLLRRSWLRSQPGVQYRRRRGACGNAPVGQAFHVVQQAAFQHPVVEPSVGGGILEPHLHGLTFARQQGNPTYQHNRPKSHCVPPPAQKQFCISQKTARGPSREDCRGPLLFLGHRNRDRRRAGASTQKVSFSAISMSRGVLVWLVTVPNEAPVNDMFGPPNSGWLKKFSVWRTYCRRMPSRITDSGNSLDTDTFALRMPGVRTQGNVRGALPMAYGAGLLKQVESAKYWLLQFEPVLRQSVQSRFGRWPP